MNQPQVSKEDRQLYPKVCPAEDCTSTRFQRGPNGGLAFNIRCETGHILAIYPGLWGSPVFALVEVVGFQALGTKGVYSDPATD